MMITNQALRDFWKQPAGKQFINACFIVIGTLSTVVVVLFTLYRTTKNDLTETTRKNGIENVLMERNCSERVAQATRDGQEKTDKAINDMIEDFRSQIQEAKQNTAVAKHEGQNILKVQHEMSQTISTIQRKVDKTHDN